VHGKSVDGALAWLSEHQDDADIDQPYMVLLKTHLDYVADILLSIDFFVCPCLHLPVFVVCTYKFPRFLMHLSLHIMSPNVPIHSFLVYTS
jgi:hypothetical protein